MKLLFLTVILTVAAASKTQSQRVVCYYANWSIYGADPFGIDKIDPKLCTHVIYSFVGLTQDGAIMLLDPWSDLGNQWTEGGFKKFMRLRQQNPAVKLLVSIGGWNEGATKFQSMVRNPQKRRLFLDSSLNFLKQYNFDGLEIDWMYQDSWGGTKEDKDGFSALVQEMKPKFVENGYLLSIATSANPVVIENSYDIAVLSKNVDFINIISYDFHGSWDQKTGHVAPLRPAARETEAERLRNVEAIVDKYIAKGAAGDKLNVGVVAYGRTFTLLDSNNHNMNSPTTGPGKVEPLPYKTFCLQDLKGEWKKYRDTEQAVPYAVSANQWVGYEDPESLAEKVKFIKAKKLGGVTFWNLDNDDFRGQCNVAGLGSFPLLKTVYQAMMKP